MVNGSCLHLGREHPGEFHLQRENFVYCNRPKRGSAMGNRCI